MKDGQGLANVHGHDDMLEVLIALGVDQPWRIGGIGL